MENVQNTIGIIGLGRMGGNLGLQAIDRGIDVVGYTKEGVQLPYQEAGIQPAVDLDDLVAKLPTPRIIFIYIPAGKIVDVVLEELQSKLAEGDIVLDGGNSYWGDSLRRYQRYKKHNLHFIDLGTSGGVDGARNGACFMAGGEEDAINKVAPILKALAVEGGYVHAGPPSTGHFVKLVHNGIEFGMLQAIGEGMQLLEEHKEKINIEDTLACWNHGSVIRSWLIELMHKLYLEKEGMNVPPYIEDTGEVNWLVEDAMKMEVPIPVIAQSVMQLFTSRDEKQYWARAVAMMRNGFGGHPFGKSDYVASERKFGKIGEYPY